MSLFSSTKNLPPPPQKPLNLDVQRAATNEQARPVPYFAGRTRLGVTFISEPFGVNSHPVRVRVGKKSQTTGYNYFCSFAAAVALGPVDRLDALYLDDELAWEGPISRGEDDYVDLTIEGRGVARFYWGTETQETDPTLATSGVSHPPYRGLCYLVFGNLFLGSNRTNVPNIEVIAGRWPDPAWMSAAHNPEDDANPIAVLWDLWTHPRYGLGLPEARLDTDQLDAVATTLHAEGISLSPVITRGMSFRQALVQLLEHFDGYLKTNSLGAMFVALVRDGGDPSVTLAEDDLLEPPDLSVQGWHETVNEVFVRFTNRDKAFQDDAASARDRNNFQVTGAIRSETLSRPWVTRQAVAEQIAAAACRRAALPEVTGQLRIRRTSSEGLDAGSVFLMDYADLGLTALRCQVTDKTIPSTDRPEAVVRFQEDRSHLNAEFYVPAADAPPEAAVYTAQAITYQRVLECPYAIARTREPYLLFLAARGDRVSSGFNLWFQVDGTFRQFKQGTHFAQRAHVVTEYPADTNVIDQAVRLEIEFDSPDNELDEASLTQALQNEFLAFAGDEILSIFEPELIAAGRYRVSCIRGRFDTRAATHPVDEGVFVIRQADLTKVWTRYEPLVQTYKIQPVLMQNEFALADCTPITHVISARAYLPVGPRNLRVNGDGHAPTYATGEGVIVSWTVTDDRRPLAPVTDLLNPEIPYTVLEVLDLAGEVKSTFTYVGTTSPQTIVNAQIVVALEAETSFEVRAWFLRGGQRSTTYDSIKVTKA